MKRVRSTSLLFVLVLLSSFAFAFEDFDLVHKTPFVFSGSSFFTKPSYTSFYLNGTTYLTGSSYLLGSTYLTGTVYVNDTICVWNSTNTTPFWDCLTGGWNVSGGGGGVTPASAPNKSIQFNYNNAFAGDSNLTWDNSENKLVVVGNGSFGEVLVVNGSYGNTSFTGNDIKMTRPAPNYVLASNAIAGLGLGAGGVNGGLFLHYSTRANTLYLNKVGVSINKGGADVALDVVGDVNVSANVTSPLYCFPDLSCFNASNFTTGGSGEVHNGTFNETDGVWLYNSTPFMVNANITAINNSLYVQWSNASSSEFFNGTFNSTSGGYVYNDTDWNIAFNETKMNDTIDDRLEPLWLNASLQQAQIDALAFGEVYNGTFNETDNTWLYNATPFNVSLNITAVNDSLYVQWLNTSTGGFTETEGYYVYNDTPTQVKFNETLLNLTIDYKLVALYVNASLQQDAIILLIQNASDQSQNITDLFANASEQSVHAELKGNPHNATLIELNDSETHGYGSAGQCLTTNSTVDGWNWSNCGTGGGSYTADGVYVYLSGSTFSFNQSAENDTIDARLVGLWANASDQSQQILVLTLNASDQSQDLLDLWVNASDQSQGISDLWSNASLQSQQIADLLVVGMSLITSLSNNWLDHDNFLYVNGSRQLTANWVTAKNISLSDADGALSAGYVTARGVFCLNNDCYTALPTGSSGDSPWYNDSQMIAAKSFYGVNASWFNASNNVTTPMLYSDAINVGGGIFTVNSNNFQLDGAGAFINSGGGSPLTIYATTGGIELGTDGSPITPIIDDAFDLGDANTPLRFRNGFFSQNVSAQNVSAYYYFDESGAFWNSSNFTVSNAFNPVTNSSYVIYPSRTALTTFNASVFNASANVSAPIVYTNTIDGGDLNLTLDSYSTIATGGLIVGGYNGSSPKLNTVYSPTETLPAAIDTATYDSFGLITQLPSGKMFIAYRQAASHVGAGDYGVIQMRTSTDNGATWSSATTIASEAGVDLRDASGGATPSGRIVVSYGRYNPDTSTSLSLKYIYSDDEGVTWSAPTTIATGANTGFLVHGGLVAIGDQKVLMSWYGNDGTNYNSYVIISEDNGKTWGSAVTAITSTSAHYNEGSFVYLGGGELIGLIRNEGGAYFRQVKSVDNGATWSDQGNTSFDSWTSPSPPWLCTFTSVGGRRMIVTYYVNRNAHKLRAVYGEAKDLLETGTTAWQDDTLYDLATTSGGGAYPSVIHPLDKPYGIGWFYNEISASDSDITFFTSPINASMFGDVLLNGGTFKQAGGGGFKKYSSVDAVDLRANLNTISSHGVLQLYNNSDDPNNEKVRIYTNGDSWFTGGQVGIGTNNPVTNLEILGNGETLRLSGTGTGNAYYDIMTFYDAAVTRHGFIGFASTTSDNMYVLNDAGNIYLNSVTGLYSQIVYDSSVTGRDVYVTTAGKLGYYSSSARNKQNVVPVTNTSILNFLHPVVFEFKPELVGGAIVGEKHYGLIAEEVAQVAPQLVYWSNQTDSKTGLNTTVADGVAYEELIPVLVKKVQEQDALIKNLTARIEKLEAVNP